MATARVGISPKPQAMPPATWVSATGSASQGGRTIAYQSATIGEAAIIIGTAKNEWMTSEAISRIRRAE